MSTTSQVTTFSDLYTDLQNRVRVTPGISATENQAKRYINTALQDIHLSFDYKLPWCERRGVIRTHAPYSDGTIALTIGSQTVTGTSTLWNTANSWGILNLHAGRKMIFAGGTDIYEVTAVGSDTTATINALYVGSANLSGATYTAFEDEYSLASDFLRPVDFRSFTDAFSIPLIDRAEFRRLYPRPNVSGRPRVATIFDMPFAGDADPVRKIAFYPYPDSTYLLPYSYVSSAVAVTAAGVEGTTLSNDTDQPTMPLRYRHVIVLHALASWYRDKRDDARAQAVQAEYIDTMKRIVEDQDIGTHVRAKIQPRMGVYTRHAYQPYSKRGGRRMDLNNEFDRFQR